MDRIILAVVSTLYDCHMEGIDEAPASSIYLALGCDHGMYTRLAQVLAGAGFARVTPNTIALTPKGRELGAQIDSTLKKLAAK